MRKSKSRCADNALQPHMRERTRKMTQEELTKYNMGRNLDDLMNLDPRGYGVCRILYPAAREYTKAPLSMSFAEALLSKIKPDSLIYILTGFVLLPFGKAEMDGIIGSVLLARALVKKGAKPVLVIPEDNLEAAKQLSAVAGIHCYTDIEDVKKYPISMAAVTFTKDAAEAEAQAERMLGHGVPAAVVAIEAPGANEKGVYHNATGLDVSALEAKSDILFEKLKKLGVPTFAIGDLGNEIGMGTLREHLLTYIPYAGIGDGEGIESCRCGCKGGIAAKTAAEHILTATVSDWGTYAVLAAMSYLTEQMDLTPTPEMEKEMIYTASRAGMIDMYGWLVPAIDGMDWTINVSQVSLMRSCAENALSLRKTCKTWFEKVIHLGYFEEERMS